MKITMSIPRTAAELSEMCGGTLYTADTVMPSPLLHICTDSREADGDTLFCAMRGERVDGHDYIFAAARAGCRAVICEHLPTEPVTAIVVEDTVRALARLAAAVRTETLSNMRTVAVTGSVGKTTTKEMIAAVMSAATRHAYKKDGNFNSVIGLPLSVMEIPADTTHAILEMGMSDRGEIAAMTAAARPDIALIINIGTSHMEQLGSRGNIAAAKLEIAEGLRPHGVLLVNGDEPLLADAETVCPDYARVMWLTLTDAKGADFAVCNIAAADGGMTFDFRTPQGTLEGLFIPAVGTHMVRAGGFAAAVGHLCGFSAACIRDGLAAYHPAPMRQSSRTVGDMTFIEDCYNAAPESMRAAFDVLDITADHMISPHRRVAVLGSMMALGEESAERHYEVGVALASHAPDLLVTVGALASHIARGACATGMPEDHILVLGADLAPDAPHAPDPTAVYPDIAAQIAPRLSSHDVLLFKASRAMQLETLIAAVEASLQC